MTSWTKQRSVRISAHTWEPAKKLAAAEGTTVSALINDYLTALVDGPRTPDYYTDYLNRSAARLNH